MGSGVTETTTSSRAKSKKHQVHPEGARTSKRRPRGLSHVTASKAIRQAFGRPVRRRPSQRKATQVHATEQPSDVNCIEKVTPFCKYCDKTFQTDDEYAKHCKFSVLHSLNESQALKQEEKEMNEKLKALSSFDLILKADEDKPAHQMKPHALNRMFCSTSIHDKFKNLLCELLVDNNV